MTDALALLAGLVLLLVFIADVYLDTLYSALGRRTLRHFSSGRFPPQEPSRWQRMLTSVTGFLIILLALGAVFLLTALFG